MIKRGLLLGLLAMALSACGNGYSHVVDRPQAEVMAALEDLDITAQPGNPGTDPSRSGGVVPDIRLEKAADHMTWWVMSGDKVATAMTVTFEMLDNGKRTRVTTSVKRGDAPDDQVSPAFRSTGITSGLFSMAIEGELEKLTAPPRASEETCRELMEKMADANLSDPGLHERPQGLGEALGQGAKTIIRLNEMRDALRRAGCPVDGDGKFKPVSNEMGAADETPTPEPTPSSSPAIDTSNDGIPGN